MRVLVVLAAVALCTALWAPVAAQDDDDDGVTVETAHEEELLEYSSPVVDQKNVYFSEHFDDQAAFRKRWVKSEAKKQGVDEDIAKYDGKWEIKSPSRKLLRDDLGLVLATEAKHAAISALLNKPFHFKEKPLIVQYEVTMQEGQNCGGAYLKLLSQGVSTQGDLKKFFDQTPYTIMFGPDKCGNDNKLHFIFRHKNPKNGSIQEKHSKKPSQRLDDIYKDKQPHLYTLIVRPDNTFTIKIDDKEVNSGSLLEDFTPPVNPPEEIEDPDDTKPQEWDEREKIVDPAATKPEDWDEDAPLQIVDTSATKPEGWLDDEPEMVPDPEAKKPEDWDNEMDGEWEAPLIDNPACANAPGCGRWSPPLIQNPAYKGPWRAPLIPNPNYKGKWTPRRIPNPHYFRDDRPFKMTPITAVGFELWSMSPALLFDNLIITDDPAVAEQWAAQTFALKQDKLNKDADSLVTWFLRHTDEKPWLWAVFLVAIITVIAFFAYLCCSSSPKDSLPEDEDAKKTDAETADDPHASEGEEGAEEGGEEEAEEGNQEEEVGGGERGDKPSKSQLETPQPDSTQETGVDSEAGGEGARKRKPRKE